MVLKFKMMVIVKMMVMLKSDGNGTNDPNDRSKWQW